jgi:hypothetical protein
MSNEVAPTTHCPKCGHLVEEGDICSPCFLRARNARMRREQIASGLVSKPKYPPLDFVRDTHPDPHADCLCEKIIEYRGVAKEAWEQAMKAGVAIIDLLPNDIRQMFSGETISLSTWKSTFAQYQDGDVVDMHIVTLLRDLINVTEAMIALRKIEPSQYREKN